MKTLSILFLLWGLFWAHPVALKAQSESRPYRKLLTASMEKSLEDSHPSVKSKREAIEHFTDSVKGVISPIPHTLSLVFHVLNKGNTRDLIAKDQIEAQVAALNRDFNKLDYSERHLADTKEGFNQLAANMELSFCLANLGEEFPSIHYVEGVLGKWPSNNSVKDPVSGGIAPWFPEKVINVWVADLEEGVSGFAQMPGGPAETDGIVIDYRFFGTGGKTYVLYNQGKTLTHLMGNYLNLHPLWGRGKGCKDDGIEDTPVHNAANTGCPGYKHLSTCGKNLVEMSMNFMDNTDDACMYMFTEGQKRRVHANFLPGGARADLLTAEGVDCISTNRLTSSGPLLPDSVNIGFPISLYPNPTQTAFSLRITSPTGGKMEVQVHSSLGVRIFMEEYSLKSGEQEVEISCQNWASGIYFLKALYAESTYTEQITIH